MTEKNPLRIVFMGTPPFSVPILEAIHKNYSIVGVYTQPDKPVGRGLELKSSSVKSKALELGLAVSQPERLSLEGEFEKLQALRPDFLVVVAYGQILKTHVLKLPRLGCVNIHSSLLPRWRGAAPIQWSLLGGDLVTGITTMRMVERLDAGDILLQESTPIENSDTATTLHDRLSLIGAKLILPTLEGLAQGTLQGKPQNEADVTYASKLTKEMETLNLHESAFQLDRKIRALNPWPGTIIQALGQRLKIKQVRLHSEIKGRPGQIFEHAGMILLGSSTSSLEILKLQWEGKKESGPSEFMNGLKGKGLKLPLEVV